MKPGFAATNMGDDACMYLFRVFAQGNCRRVLWWSSGRGSHDGMHVFIPLSNVYVLIFVLIERFTLMRNFLVRQSLCLAEV